MYLIKRIFNPEIFQGKYRHNNYFEGWYYKIIDKASENIIAVIPGVAVSKNRGHSFIQFIDAKTGFTEYFNFPRKEFSYSERELEISIMDNYFSRAGMRLELNSQNTSIYGEIDFTDIVPFPKSLLNPGIMGPYSFVPFMECHHGIINIHSRLKGFINYNGKHIAFNEGSGYVEKDWGKSFPHSWIWLQCNSFKTRDTSLMFSIASIPWLGREFDGLIAFLKVGGSFFRFATYTGARLKCLKIHEKILNIEVEDRKSVLCLKVAVGGGGMLKAPKKGLMEVEITESITSTVEVLLVEKPGKIIFHDTGENTGLELAGNFKKFAI
ncbi:hypothetical protein CLHUN_19440 [Ruminiclostridium hungatei]|uniref:Tocopherol cyclase n=1 Tax=Ruminiclostridium hungatei TaxID=48256 RepID=A0A1V4SKY7_RUMHU|nr:tocopherol cyclase family protein [Ruminiclostridium hungatei]OPX44145.1 hypothetical protein CLHUN_19440 [Ruminiclostridium hungatei]